MGRRRELDELHAALARGEHLVTIVGTAGVGKTRLAREFALGGGRPPGGMRVHLCTLVNARTEEELLEAVLSSLRLPVEGPAAQLDRSARIGRGLARLGAVLLVLDNLEHLIDFAARTVGAWHKAAPDALLLCTSRVPLALPGERVVAVEPLSVELAADGPSEDPGEGVELFLERASAALGRELQSAEERRRATEVVRQLEGLPLAIELAAARLEVLSLLELQARLGQRFELLRDPSRAPREHHATLWRAIDWSWELLTPMEQRALAQCSVFEGSFALDAAEELVSSAGLEECSVLDAVQSLARKSLLRVHREGEAPRLHWYESVREYAAARLEASGEGASLRARHTEWYLARGLQWVATDDELPDAEGLERLLAEHDNLLAVLRRSLAVAREPDGRAKGAEQALRALFVLRPVLSTRGSPVAHGRMLDEALGAAAGTSAERSLWWMHARFARAATRRVRGDAAGQREDLEAAVAEASARGLGALEARFRAHLGDACELAGARVDARRELERAVADARHLGDRATEGTARVFLGIHFMNGEELAAAKAQLDAALPALRATKQRKAEELALAHLGILAADTGEDARAREYYRQAAALSRSLGMQRREAIVTGFLAVDAHLRGALNEARAYYEHALAMLREAGDRRFTGVYEGYAGLLALEASTVPEALARLEDAVGALREGTDARSLAAALSGLALAHARAGATARARACSEEARGLFAGLASPVAGRSFAPVLDAALALAEARAGVELERSLAEVERAPLSDLRLAVRALRAALAEARERAACWSIEAEGRWFEAPDGARCSLEKRPTLAALLAALLRHRLAEEGGAVSLKALLAAAWPGERVAENAGRNRVRVALSSLRKLGLGSLLESSEGGYALRRDVHVRAAEAPSAHARVAEMKEDGARPSRE